MHDTKACVCAKVIMHYPTKANSGVRIPPDSILAVFFLSKFEQSSEVHTSESHGMHFQEVFEEESHNPPGTLGQRRLEGCDP